MSSTNQPSREELNALVALFGQGQFLQAAAVAQSLTGRFPQHPAGWIVLGAALKQLGRDAEALAPMRKAVELAPGHAESHSNLGATLRELGQSTEAAACARRALALKPDLVEAHVNLGNALTDLGRLEEAVTSYGHALHRDATSVLAHNGLGNALTRLGRLDAAVLSCRRAIELAPDYAFARFNLGVALSALGRLDDALVCYEQVLARDPDFLGAHDNLLFVRSHQAGRAATVALTEAQRYGEVVARRGRPFAAWRGTRDPHRRLRVGLVSGDLGDHPVGYFLDCILAAAHGSLADRVEFVGYPTFAHEGAVATRLRRCCGGWHPAAGLSDEALARQIHGDGIDVLIDLAGHTANNRLPVFAWKPAPVQATWLGYLATTGVAAIDYVIADPWTLPAAEEKHFTEQAWRLPECYLCFTPPGDDPAVAPPPALADGRVTFGSFNNLTKLNDEVVALWAAVLLSVPDSRLFLKTAQLGQESVRAAVQARFAAHGVEAARLILEGRSPRAELLAAYRRVDVALDPFPYPGITTTLEALWMGVPVLSLAGGSFLSRQGVGLLRNAGLPGWIAADEADYLAKASAFARDVPGLARVRAGLRAQLQASPLLDAPRFAVNLEAALRGMWERWCNGRPVVAGGAAPA